MPLVWGLTRELKEWLTPAHLQEMANIWKARGRGIPSHVVDALAQRLSRDDEHYEGLIAWLQSEQFRHGPDSRHYHSLVGMLQDVVGEIIRSRHVRNPDYHRHSLPWFRGLASAVPQDTPLWVFTLNHDLHIEFLATELGLAVAAGFPEARAIGFTGPGGRHVWFDRVARSALGNAGYLSTRGINLVKLHGALDVFAYKDLNEFLRVCPDDPTIQGWLNALTDIEQLGTRISGEICVDDEQGVMQFLRRTVVTGGYKFDERAGYNAPSDLLEFFARKLEDFDELAVVGYSWCDQHINGPIEAWLAGAAHRRVINVDPGGLNARAAHLASRIDDRRVSAAEFLATFDARPIDPATARERDFRLEILRLGSKNPRIQEAFNRVASARIDAVVAWAAQQNLTAPQDPAMLLSRFAAEQQFDALNELIRELRAVR